MSLVFDIETRPRPESEIKSILPAFDPNSITHPGEFDESKVKTGNLKDPAKIKGKIAEAKIKHQKALKDYDAKIEGGEDAYWAESIDKAPLSAECGQVCAIGYGNEVGGILLDLDCELSEKEILTRFWSKYRDCRASSRDLIGFNSNRFDIPFLCRRSWYLGLEVPGSVFTQTGWLANMFVDLLARWQCGDKRAWVKLDLVCRAAGLQSKPSDCTGADFHRMLDDKKTRPVAINYLRGDIEMTVSLAIKLGAM